MIFQYFPTGPFPPLKQHQAQLDEEEGADILMVKPAMPGG